MKKKLKFTIIISILGCLVLPLMAQTNTGYELMPQSAKDFIANTFKGVTVVHTSLNDREFSVVLSNGVNVEFRNDGDRKRVV